jgi:hypothetical protein
MAKTSRFLLLVSVALLLSLGRLAVPVDCQERAPADGPCSDAVAQRAKGRWIHAKDLLYDLSVGFVNEASKRMDEMHRMLTEVYPSPTGVDAEWHRHKGHVLFADDVTHAKGIPVGGYYYSVGFFRYFCDPSNKNRMIGGSPGETGTFFSVSSNCNFPWESIADESWAINGRPVVRRAPLKQMWKGHPMFRGSNFFTVLIHRKEILPYLPVTRKQYLNHSIQHLTEIFEGIIDGFRQMPVRSSEAQEAEKKSTLERFAKTHSRDPKKLKAATDHYLSGYQTDQQRRDEQVSKQIQIKNGIVKRYVDELEKTTREGLLDSPAVVSQVHSPDMTTPIFISEAEEGTMLITENPAYMRKDLPKYVPQILVLGLRWNDWEPQKNISKVVEEKFPVERLQAMIDR